MRHKYSTLVKALLIFFDLEVGEAFANPDPKEASVSNGTVSFSEPDHNTLVINQSTQKAIINWNTFDVKAGEAVQFNDAQGASSVTVNRVANAQAVIDGTLTSNGQVWLIDEQGVVFGKDASVNVAGLVASTLNMTDEDFKNGKYQFNQHSEQAAQVINQGHINAGNGYVAMLAPEINNSGIVEAKLGTVALEAVKEATLSFNGNQLLNIAVPVDTQTKLYDSAGKEVALTNSGTIAADGGRVIMTAQGMDELLDESINLTGVIKADSVAEKNGSIILTAGNQTVLTNASISAQGLKTGETGGSVEILGHDVGLFGDTKIDASGAAGGGQIHVGWNKDDPNAVEATATVIDSKVALDASATQNGDGGFIETSGHYLRARSGRINTLGAHSGKDGTWLLDPYNLTISNSSDSDVASNPFQPDGGDANLSVATLLTALGNSNVTVQTGNDLGSGSGDITVSDAISYTGSNPRTLTLNAAGDININADISDTTGGALSLGLWTNNNIGYNNALPDRGNINIHGSVSVAGSGGTGSAGNTNLQSTQDIQLSNINTSGYLYVTAGGAITQAADTALTVSGLANFDTNRVGDVTLDNSGNNFSSLEAYAANVVVRDTDGLQLDAVSAQSLKVTAGGDLTQVGSTTTGITVDGLTELNVGSHDITLTNADGDGHPINTINSVRIDAANNVNVSTQTALDLAQADSTSLGSLTINTYGGAVTQSTALNVTGATIIDTTNGAGARDITLTTSGNDFHNQSLSLTGANISLTDTNSAINIGLLRSEQTGNILLTAAGGISDSDGGIDMTRGAPSGRTATFNLTDDGSGNIDLSGNNAFNNSEVVVGSGGAAPGAVTIKDGYNSLTVGSINAGALTLETTHANASIGQASDTAITTTGTTTVTAGTNGDINLTNVDNDFGNQAVSLSGSAINIVDNNATGLVLGSVTTSGTLSATAAGAITQSGSTTLIVGGNTTLDAGTHTISLGNANELDGTITVGHAGITAGAVTIESGTGSLTIAQVDNNTDTKLSSLSLNSAGTINQASALNVTGTTSLAATANINLTDSANDFNTIQIDHSQNVELVNAGTLHLDGISATNNVTLSADNLDNQGGASAIAAGGSWNIYLANLGGNTFGSLASDNQAIWNTTYGTPITQAGNRYIFGTAENLIFSPLNTPFALSKYQGASIDLPAAIPGTNYQVSGFVDATNYNNVFVQDSVNNVNISGVSYTSTGASPSAPVDTYSVTMTGIATVDNGYTAFYDSEREFGILNVTDAPPVPPTSPIPSTAYAADVNPAVVMDYISKLTPAQGHASSVGANSDISTQEHASDVGANPDLTIKGFHTADSTEE